MRRQALTMIDASFAPVIVHERGQIAALLAARRAALGLTCEELDARIGFSDRYTSKLEHPFVQNSPALKDEAQAIAELLEQFYLRIRAAE